jgi:hypothetical protein
MIGKTLSRSRLTDNVLSQLERNYIPEPNSGCWIWLGGLRGNTGYGTVSIKGYGTTGAHRASYAAHKGDVPSHLVVRHKCDVPMCVNPDHLELGTQQNNIDDAIARGRFIGNGRFRKVGKKLDEAKALAIFNSMDTASVEAAKFGISIDMVKCIRRGKSWRQVSLGRLPHPAANRRTAPKPDLSQAIRQHSQKGGDVK